MIDSCTTPAPNSATSWLNQAMKPASSANPNDAQTQLTPRDLKPGDVLLSKGQGVVSDLIAAVDGGKYSHGALWSGSGVIQATHEGITESLPAHGHDVYRRNQLSDTGASEVVAAGRAQLGGGYAYSELVLLGLLFALGLRVQGALFDRMLEAIGGTRATKLQAWFESNPGKTRVCTELVASCFFDTTDRLFALRIVPRAQRGKSEADAPDPDASALGQPSVATRRAAGVEASPQFDSARSACYELLAESGVLPTYSGDTEAVAQTRKLLSGAVALDAFGDALVGVVTPADLQYSPSLQFVGSVHV